MEERLGLRIFVKGDKKTLVLGKDDSLKAKKILQNYGKRVNL